MTKATSATPIKHAVATLRTPATPKSRGKVAATAARVASPTTFARANRAPTLAINAPHNSCAGLGEVASEIEARSTVRATVAPISTARADASNMLSVSSRTCDDDAVSSTTGTVSSRHRLTVADTSPRVANAARKAASNAEVFASKPTAAASASVVLACSSSRAASANPIVCRSIAVEERIAPNDASNDDPALMLRTATTSVTATRPTSPVMKRRSSTRTSLTLCFKLPVSKRPVPASAGMAARNSAAGERPPLDACDARAAAALTASDFMYLAARASSCRTLYRKRPKLCLSTSLLGNRGMRRLYPRWADRVARCNLCSFSVRMRAESSPTSSVRRPLSTAQKSRSARSAAT
mmetsp:Transcript_11512/g.40177  ORF Transcript_11512/g.40177 Transcript_11512/m.40177 type:complete len:353 (+) Transcript_11512:2386-3444(+)